VSSSNRTMYLSWTRDSEDNNWSVGDTTNSDSQWIGSPRVVDNCYEGNDLKRKKWWLVTGCQKSTL
jgi:hypothetical protein